MSSHTYNLLPSPPKRGKGVSRLNRVPLAIGFAVGLLALGVIAYTFNQRMAQSQADVTKAQDDALAGDSDRANTTLATHKHAPDDKPGAPPDPKKDTEKHDSPPAGQAQAGAVDLAEQARVQAWQQYYQAANEEHRKAAEAQNTALTDSSGVSFAEPGSTASTGTPGALGPKVAMGSSGGAGGSNLDGFPPASGGDGGQAEKRAFLNQGGDVLGLNEDLPAVQHGPKPNTIMEGTALAGVMVGGMTSDMPGMVVGQVSQNVCDSKTGDNLLIPQGTKVVGIYDNSVTNGQERIGVIWSRLIFPDTSSLQLGSMEGADQGGYAGFNDIVHTHFWQKLGSAVLISIAGAAVQLAQPQAPVGGYYSPTQIGAGQVTQQLSQMGSEYARAGLSIPNSLEIRPGYLFNIMVRQDIHLKPYHGWTCADPGVESAGSTPINLGPVLR